MLAFPGPAMALLPSPFLLRTPASPAAVCKCAGRAAEVTRFFFERSHHEVISGGPRAPDARQSGSSPDSHRAPSTHYVRPENRSSRDIRPAGWAAAGLDATAPRSLGAWRRPVGRGRRRGAAVPARVRPTPRLGPPADGRRAGRAHARRHGPRPRGLPPPGRRCQRRGRGALVRPGPLLLRRGRGHAAHSRRARPRPGGRQAGWPGPPAGAVGHRPRLGRGRRRAAGGNPVTRRRRLALERGVGHRRGRRPPAVLRPADRVPHARLDQRPPGEAPADVLGGPVERVADLQVAVRGAAGRRLVGRAGLADHVPVEEVVRGGLVPTGRGESPAPTSSTSSKTPPITGRNWNAPRSCTRICVGGRRFAWTANTLMSTIRRSLFSRMILGS